MKKKSLAALIRPCAAALCFAAPPALYFILIKSRLSPGVILYSCTGFVWLLAAAAAASAYIALRAPYKGGAGIDGSEEYEYAEDDGKYPECAEDAETKSEYIEEYAELYGDGTADKEQPEHHAPDIAAAILAQKTLTTDSGLTTEVSEADSEAEGAAENEADAAWRKFIGDGIAETESIPDIYENIPDTLPDGYSFSRDDDEETDSDMGEISASKREDGFGEACGKPYENDGTNAIDTEGRRKYKSAVIRTAAGAALVLSIAAGALLSGIYVADRADGVTVGGIGGVREYLWSDAKNLEVSPATFGINLKITLTMSDGKRVTVCSGSMNRGDNPDFKGAGDCEIYAYICQKVEEAGAEKTVRNIKTIESRYMGTDEWEYVRRIIDTGDGY